MPSDPPIRVLLIEDNPGDARLIADSLASGPSRFELRVVDRLGDLLPALAAGGGAVDIILLDLGLPDGQGLDSFRSVQAAAPGVPVVVLSGLSDQDVAIRAVREGAQDYLVKGKLDGDPLPRIVRHAVERRRADEALRRSEARFRAAVEASPDAFGILEALRDASGRIWTFVPTDLNTRAEKLLGGTIGKLAGRPSSEWCPFDHHDESVLTFSRVVETREPVEQELMNENPATGAISWSLRQVYPLGDGVAVIVRDITARKRMEEHLRHTQKIEAVGQLAAGVAHDFRNLVSAIQGQLFHARKLLPDDHAVIPFLDHIEDAAGHASRIAGSLLTFTRRSPAEKRPIELATVVHQAVGLLKHSLPASIQVETRIAEPSPFVNADANLLQQVIMNLALNARDAMPSGGSLLIEAGAASETVETPRGPRGAARLIVRDTGIGMTPEVRARIFEPYFTTKPRDQGTGLGLPIIHGIIMEHGGDISVESAPGAGTTFTVTLPAVDPPKAAIPPPPRELNAALLVDSNPFVREVVTSMLFSLGYEVLQAANTAAAVRLARSAGLRLALIVAAAQLPDEGGVDCIHQVWAAGQKGVKAILLAAPDSPINGNGFGVLSQPFRQADLAREVERLREADA